MPSPDPLHIRFQGNLRELLHPRLRNRSSVGLHLREPALIKDVIESLRVPHPEVGIIEINDQPVDFTRLVQGGEEVTILPLPVPCPVLEPTLLRPHPLDRIAFLVDINAGKLGRLLRMAGFDTLLPSPGQEDGEIARTAVAQGRILLSRDRDLLKRSIIDFAHLVRAQDPWQQLAEILTLYGLEKQVDPFSRCLKCNTPLRPVAREQILERLQPLTRKYYNRFAICPGCDRIYWQGSHHEKMLARLSDILHRRLE